MLKLNVIVVGAGLGGLCLAQALRRLIVDVAVFERDRTPWARPQGYRLHLDSDGINAIHQSLPPALYELFDATSMKPLSFSCRAAGDGPPPYEPVICASTDSDGVSTGLCSCLAVFSMCDPSPPSLEGEPPACHPQAGWR